VKSAALIPLVLVAAQGCASAPHGVAAAGGMQHITWTRGLESEAFQDQHGVCHTFSRDSELAMRGLGSQVQACFERSLPVVTTNAPAPRGVKVAWEKVPAGEIDALFAETAQPSVLHAAGRTKASAMFAVRGFYVQRGDTCHVLVSDHADYLSTLGHEFKHCVDGDFHDARGVWRSARAG
jgi:hypothetical protein